jgi:hypothetical protein
MLMRFATALRRDAVAHRNDAITVVARSIGVSS